MNLNDAVEAAVDQCIEEGVLTEYLRRQRAEVCEMFLTEYDEADERRRLENEVRIAKEHAQEQGHRQGFEQGLESRLKAVLEKMTPTEADRLMHRFDSVAELRQWLDVREKEIKRDEEYQRILAAMRKK